MTPVVVWFLLQVQLSHQEYTAFLGGKRQQFFLWLPGGFHTVTLPTLFPKLLGKLTLNLTHHSYWDLQLAKQQDIVIQ